MSLAAPFSTPNLHPGAHLVQSPLTDSKFEGGRIVFEDPKSDDIDPKETDWWKAVTKYRHRFKDIDPIKIMPFIWNAKEWKTTCSIDTTETYTPTGQNHPTPSISSLSLSVEGKFLEVLAEIYGSGHYPDSSYYKATFQASSHADDPYTKIDGSEFSERIEIEEISVEGTANINKKTPLGKTASSRCLPTVSLFASSGNGFWSGQFPDKEFDIHDDDDKVVGHTKVTGSTSDSWRGFRWWIINPSMLYVKSDGSIDLLVEIYLSDIYGLVAIPSKLSYLMPSNYSKVGQLNATFFGSETILDLWKSDSDASALSVTGTISYDINITEKWTY